MKVRVISVFLFAIGVVLGASERGEGSGGSSYRVLVLGDLHFDGEEFHRAPPASVNKRKERERNLRMWKARSPRLLETASGRAKAEKAVFAVQLGDLVQGDCDDRDLQRAMIVRGFGMLKGYFNALPLVIVKGNHDIRTVKKHKDNAVADSTLMPLVAGELGIPTPANGNYAFTQGQDLFIGIDGFLPAGECVAFVKKTLAEHPKTRYVFFMTHLPILPASVGSPFWLLPGHHRISALLETRRTVILAAHTHIPSLVSRSTVNGKLVQLIVSSVGTAWSRRVSPAPLGDWPSYAAAVKKHLAQGKNAVKSEKEWLDMESMGTYTYEQLFYNAGFAVLDVDDRGVAARYYTDGSDKPALTLPLVSNL